MEKTLPACNLNSGEKKDQFLKPYHIHVMLNPFFFKCTIPLHGYIKKGDQKARPFLFLNLKKIVEKEEELSVICYL